MTFGEAKSQFDSAIHKGFRRNRAWSDPNFYIKPGSGEYRYEFFSSRGALQILGNDVDADDWEMVGR